MKLSESFLKLSVFPSLFHFHKSASHCVKHRVEGPRLDSSTCEKCLEAALVLPVSSVGVSDVWWWSPGRVKSAWWAEAGIAGQH